MILQVISQFSDFVQDYDETLHLRLVFHAWLDKSHKMLKIETFRSTISALKICLTMRLSGSWKKLFKSQGNIFVFLSSSSYETFAYFIFLDQSNSLLPNVGIQAPRIVILPYQEQSL